MRRWFNTLVVIAVSTLATMTSAWGPEGHIAVARVAQQHISPSAVSAVSTMIPEGDLASVANWPDTVRSNPAWRWSEPLHFIDTPSWVATCIKKLDNS